MNNFSENINEIGDALAKAQSKMQPASRDKANPFFKSKYADLASVWSACREALTENKISVLQTFFQKEKGYWIHNENLPSPNSHKVEPVVHTYYTGMVLVTTLLHASGQWARSEMPINVAKNDPQTLGSTITYYRRYSLSALVGVAPDDDDGEKAQTPYRQVEKKEEPKQKKIISTIEVENLKSILKECDQDYQDWVYEYLNQNLKISDLSQITTDVYEKMKTAAEKRVKKQQENKILEKAT